MTTGYPKKVCVHCRQTWGHWLGSHLETTKHWSFVRKDQPMQEVEMGNTTVCPRCKRRLGMMSSQLKTPRKRDKRRWKNIAKNVRYHYES